MQNGTNWLIYKFVITKLDFEKVSKNGSTQDFHKTVYDEILYPDLTKLLPVFFNNWANAIKEAILGRVQRKYPVALENQTMLILATHEGILNIFITPKL